MTKLPTPNYQKVILAARQEAERFNHNYVGTEHVLLGLIKLGEGKAIEILKKKGIDLNAMGAAVEERVGTAKPEKTKLAAELPLTPRVKIVAAHSNRIAKSLQHDFVGTEHLLLALLEESGGIGPDVLKAFELTHDEALEILRSILEQ